MNIPVIITVLILFVVADKALTVMNIHEVNKNFPEAMKEDKYKIERNPVAKWFFQKTGLFWGSILMSILSLLQIAIAYFILKKGFNHQIALYVIFLVYGFVIVNNFYFYLKYSKVI